MESIRWFKISTNIFSDEKMRLIESMPEKDTLFFIWIKLIHMATVCADFGRIYMAEDKPYSEDELITLLNRPGNTVRLALATFERYGMIQYLDDGAIFLPNFPRHQSADELDRIRATSRLSSQRYRDKQKLLNSGVESCVTSRVTPGDILDKNRIDKEKNRKEKMPREPRGDTDGLGVNELIKEFTRLTGIRMDTIVFMLIKNDRKINKVEKRNRRKWFLLMRELGIFEVFKRELSFRLGRL